jgi:hypothetical protein
MNKNILYSIFLLFLAASCGPSEVEPSTNSLNYDPILMPRSEMENAIAWLPSRDLNAPGRIHVKGDTIYINEQYKGVHVLDNRNPKNPVPLGFIRIPGNLDMAVKHHILYADNAVDLIAIDLKALPNIRVTQRVRNCFDKMRVPQGGFSTSYYSSQIPADAVVVGWRKK